MIQDEFLEQGFVVVPELFSSDSVERIRTSALELESIARERFKELDWSQAKVKDGSSEIQVFESESEITVGNLDGVFQIKRVHNVLGACPELEDLVFDVRMKTIVSDLLESTFADFLISSFHYKNPGDGVVFPWHQDIAHRRAHEGKFIDINGLGSYVQTYIAIDEVTEDSGPLQFIPLRVERYCNELNTLPFDSETRHLLPEAYEGKEIVTPLLKPGDVVFFHPYAPHGSKANTGTKSRLGFVNGFAWPKANLKQYPGVGYGRRVILL